MQHENTLRVCYTAIAGGRGGKTTTQAVKEPPLRSATRLLYRRAACGGSALQAMPGTGSSSRPAVDLRGRWTAKFPWASSKWQNDAETNPIAHSRVDRRIQHWLWPDWSAQHATDCMKIGQSGKHELWWGRCVTCCQLQVGLDHLRTILAYIWWEHECMRTMW